MIKSVLWIHINHINSDKGDNIWIMFNNEAHDVIKELFDLLKNRYQNNLKGNELILNRWKVMILSSVMFIYCILNVLT